MDFENMVLRAGQKKAGQNETGQVLKCWQKLGQLNFLLKITGHVRLYGYN